MEKNNCNKQKWKKKKKKETQEATEEGGHKFWYESL